MAKRKNTQAWTFLSWASFALAIFAEYIGVYYLDAPLSVKGYYAVTGAFLVMSSFVLQKTIRDNQEDEDEKPAIVVRKEITTKTLSE